MEEQKPLFICISECVYYSLNKYVYYYYYYLGSVMTHTYIFPENQADIHEAKISAERDGLSLVLERQPTSK